MEEKYGYIVTNVAHKRLLSVDDDRVENGACANNSTSQHCRPDIFIILIIKMKEKKETDEDMDSNKNITLH